MNFFSTRNILLGLIAIVLALHGLIYLDQLKYDGDGLVKGIDLKPYPPYLYYLIGIFSFMFLFSLKKLWLQKLLIVLLTFGISIAGIEYVFGVLNKIKQEKAPKYDINGPAFSMKDDLNLGFVLEPSKKLHYKKIQNDTLLYDVKFETDQYSHRITPKIAPLNRQKYALFFGCSFTFGLGVHSNETTAYYFQEKNKDYATYNLANSAYGPHQMLAKLQEGRLRNIIKEPGGIAFYTYIPDHVNRAISGTNTFQNADGKSPYFVEENGKMVRNGLFKDRDIFTKLFYKIIIKSNFFSYFQIRYPFRLTNNHYKFIGNMLAESAKTYEEQFNNDQFYIIFYPTNEDYSPIINRLKQLNIKYLDYSKLFDPLLPQYHLLNDGHPSALANKILVEQILKEVKLP